MRFYIQNLERKIYLFKNKNNHNHNLIILVIIIFKILKINYIIQVDDDER
jgi:hypothetical protein